MYRILALIPVALLCASCSETTGGSGSIASGVGMDSSEGTARGTINPRSDGGYTFVLNRGGTVCTAVFESPFTAGKTDLSPMNCSGGGSGTATVVYGSDRKPESVVYAEVGSGGGTIRF